MSKEEYQVYQEAVRRFFEREGIENLSTGLLDCPDCACPLSDGRCPNCGKSVEEMPQEAYFSWRPCPCCGRPEGGDREDAHGYNPTERQIQRYSVCTDCVYYAEYGCLDDQTMAEVERNAAITE